VDHTSIRIIKQTNTSRSRVKFQYKKARLSAARNTTNHHIVHIQFNTIDMSTERVRSQLNRAHQQKQISIHLRAINRIHSQNVKKQNLNRDHVVANTADPEHIGVPQRFFSVVFGFISFHLSRWLNSKMAIQFGKYIGSINQYNSSSNSITKEIP